MSSDTSTPWVIVHVPHASRVIPADIRSQLLVDDTMLKKELNKLTDHHTDDLFAVDDVSVILHRYPVSRFVVDPERFPDDGNEPMAKRGQGVVYTRTTDGRPLRTTQSDIDRKALLDRYYWPHHRRLEQLVAQALAAHDRALIVDGHSFPNNPLPVDLDQRSGRPDICLGTDPYHTPRELVDRLAGHCRGKGYSVGVNRPLSGALVPCAFYRKDNRVAAIMIELNRRLYLTAETLDVSRSDNFANVHHLVVDLVNTAMESLE